jgi:hypothetical protein
MLGPLRIVLEDSVEPPARRSGGAGKRPIYPFGTMKVGQSFTLPIELRAKLNNAAKIWRRRHEGWGFVIRTDGKKVRLWRLE